MRTMPLKGYCPHKALIGLTQASGLAGDFDYRQLFRREHHPAVANFPVVYTTFYPPKKILRREAGGEPFRHALTGNARMRLRVPFIARVVEAATGALIRSPDKKLLKLFIRTSYERDFSWRGKNENLSKKEKYVEFY